MTTICVSSQTQLTIYELILYPNCPLTQLDDPVNERIYEPLPFSSERFLNNSANWTVPENMFRHGGSNEQACVF